MNCKVNNLFDDKRNKRAKKKIKIPHKMVNFGLSLCALIWFSSHISYDDFISSLSSSHHLRFRSFPSVISNSKLSYMHKIGTEPLRYVTIGQVFEETANKFPDRFSLISCLEGTRITFAESLEKVSKTTSSLPFKFRNNKIQLISNNVGRPAGMLTAEPWTRTRRSRSNLGAQLRVLVYQQLGNCPCRLDMRNLMMRERSSNNIQINNE